MDSTNFKGAGLSALQKINSNDNPATILKGLDIKPNKSLGQNFLRDNIISKAIVESLDCNENDVVIEIGIGPILYFILISNNIIYVYNLDD